MHVHPIIHFEGTNLVFGAVVLMAGIALLRVRGHRVTPEGESAGTATGP